MPLIGHAERDYRVRVGREGNLVGAQKRGAGAGMLVAENLAEVFRVVRAKCVRNDGDKRGRDAEVRLLRQEG